MTRLRVPFLQAIEKEAWDELPAPVFVRGFVRSYARALGLDEQRVLALYDQARPLEPSVPRPLLEPEKTGRGRRILLILLLGVLAGILLYMWQGHPAPEWPLPRGKSAVTEGKKRQDRPVTSIDKKPTPVRSQAEKMPGGVKETFPVPIEPLVESEALDMSNAEPAPLPENLYSFPDASERDTVTEEPLVLEADVRQRTWMQVSVDGEESRNFLFETGSHPRWVAKGSFNLLIGNASGIVLYFGGKKLENLGKPGQVVRVRLPGDMETSDALPTHND